jgi:hypothetical protein
MIEERHPRLHAARHAHPVALDQQVIDQPGVQVGVEHAIERFVAAAAFEVVAQALGGVSSCEHAGLDDLSQGTRIKGAEPGGKALGRVGDGEVFQRDARAAAAERENGRRAAQERSANARGHPIQVS